MADPVRRTLTIAAAPDRVLSVVTDFENYPSWQKEIESCEVLERDGDGRPRRVAMTTAAMGMKANSEIAVEFTDDGVKWHLTSGDMMTRNDSHYVLRASDEGTDVDLEMAIELTWNLPDFMMNQIITKGVNDNLKAIKKTAEA